MTMLRRLMAGALAGAALHALLGAQVVLAQQDSTDPIRLAVNDWTGAHVTTHIAGSVLSEVGYKRRVRERGLPGAVHGAWRTARSRSAWRSGSSSVE